MHDADDLSSSLPPPRDDEPSALRSDILDELADHLSLAHRRETLRRPDAGDAQIRQAVLDRFGNPRNVARQLYLDAMKERIMKDRILIGLMVVMTLAIVAVSAMAFASFRQNQQMMQTLLAKLNQPQQPQTATSERGSIEVVMVDDEGKPRAGIEVSLKGAPLRPGEEIVSTETTDAAGRAFFQQLLPGAYYTSLASNDNIGLRRRVLLMPSTQHTERIVYPHSPEPVWVKVITDPIHEPSTSPTGFILHNSTPGMLRSVYSLPERFGDEWWRNGSIIRALYVQLKPDGGHQVHPTSGIGQRISHVDGSWITQIEIENDARVLEGIYHFTHIAPAYESDGRVLYLDTGFTFDQPLTLVAAPGAQWKLPLSLEFVAQWKQAADALSQNDLTHLSEEHRLITGDGIKTRRQNPQ